MKIAKEVTGADADSARRHPFICWQSQQWRLHPCRLCLCCTGCVAAAVRSENVVHFSRTHLMCHELCQHDGSILIVWLVLKQRSRVCLACLYLQSSSDTKRNSMLSAPRRLRRPSCCFQSWPTSTFGLDIPCAVCQAQLHQARINPTDAELPVAAACDPTPPATPLRAPVRLRAPGVPVPGVQHRACPGALGKPGTPPQPTYKQ
jgi:hypothetical protein